MIECPTCCAPLNRRQTTHGYVYCCRQCRGLAATLPVLRKAGATREFLRELWQRIHNEGAPRRRRCPHCMMPMAEVSLPAGGHRLTLDACARCAAIWFDATQYEAVPRRPEPKPTPIERTMSPEAREQLALCRVKQIGEDARRESFNEGPDQAWQWLPALLGLPVELEAPAVSQRPWVTWTVTVLCVMATLPILGDEGLPQSETFRQWGFIPADWARGGGITLLTSFFLHAGWFHLLGNLYFLMVFGDNVEDRLGRVAFVALLAGGHLAGMVAHGAFGADASMPCIGASAGISSVIAFYALEFPKVRLGFMFRYFLLFRWFHLSAAWALVLYAFMQIFGVYFQILGASNVSYLGHLGGLAVGVAAIFVYRSRQRREVAKAID